MLVFSWRGSVICVLAKHKNKCHRFSVCANQSQNKIACKQKHVVSYTITSFVPSFRIFVREGSSFGPVWAQLQITIGPTKFYYFKIHTWKIDGGPAACPPLDQRISLKRPGKAVFVEFKIIWLALFYAAS